MFTSTIRLLLPVEGFALLAVVACAGSSTGATTSTSAASSSGTATGAGAIGDACPNGKADCLPGLDCAGEDPGGGQCEKPCKPSQDSDCGDVSKYACNNEGHCYVRCSTTVDCKRAAQGYVCKDDVPPRGVKFCDVP